MPFRRSRAALPLASAVVSGRAGREDAARHGREHRSERNTDVLAACGRQILRDLRGVAMDAADAVGADRAHDLRTQQIGLRRPAGARSATDRNHVHVRLHDPRGNGGGQREARYRRVAARHGDAGRAYAISHGHRAIPARPYGQLPA